MIDRRCLLCREYRDVLGTCPGASVEGGDLDAAGGVLACWTPIPDGGPEIDALSGELVNREHDEPAFDIPGPEFPDGLVGRLLSSGPIYNAGDGRSPGTPGDIPPAAAARAKGATTTAPLADLFPDVGSARGSGKPKAAARVIACTSHPAPPATINELRCCCVEPSAAGVESATSRVADSQGRRMVPFGICGRLLVGLAIIGSIMPADAMEGAAIHQPAAAQGTRDGRPGVAGQLTIDNAQLTAADAPVAAPLSTVHFQLSTARLLAAMRQVESKGDDNAVGDEGESIGPYQIQLPYWTDGGGDAGRYRLDAWHADRCVPVILGYWRRYCPRALAAGDFQTLARTHNGGPKWNKTAKRRAEDHHFLTTRS